MKGYDGIEIKLYDRIELSPACDLWMQGARYGHVTRIVDDMAYVRMDHGQVKKLVKVPSNLMRLETYVRKARQHEEESE